jgi:hypothetical protein
LVVEPESEDMKTRVRMLIGVAGNEGDIGEIIFDFGET